jgi:DNA-binding CsgD family transcriptional regulator
MLSSTGTGSYLGREEQLDRLLARLTRAAEGQGGWLAVSGVPGMGVSTTLAELAAHGEQLGFGVLRGTSREGIAGRPLGAIAEAVEGQAASTDPVRLYDELGDAAPALVRLAPGLRSALPATPPPAPLDPPEERLRLWDGCLTWLRRAAGHRPLLVALDDLQWADDDSWALLQHVSRFLDAWPVLIVTGWSVAGESTERLPPPEVERVELPGLDEGALAALLARSSNEHVTREVARLVQQASGGNPLAALQLHRHLLEERRIGRPGGQPLPSADELPTTVGEIVAWRLSRLSADERAVLGTLACFPLAVSVAAVATVSGLHRPRAAGALERLAAAGYVRSPEGSGIYQLEHAQLAAAIRAGLSPGVRAEAYARAAEALELELGGEARRHAATLAELYRLAAAESDPRHVTSAGRAAAGARYGLIASEHARAGAAHGRAADCLEVALDLAIRGDQSIQHDLRARLALAQAEAGRSAAALATGMSALEAGDLDRSSVDTLVATVRALVATGAHDQARLLRESIARRAPSDRLLDARLSVLAGEWRPFESGSVRFLVWQGAEEEAEETLLSEAREEDVSRLFAPQRPRSHDQTVALLEMARGWRQPTALLRALHGATIDLATRLGHFREAASWAGEYLAAAERYGSPRDHLQALLLLGQCRAALGSFDDAGEALSIGRELGARLPTDESLDEEMLLAEMALAHYLEGDWPDLAARAANLGARHRPTGMLIAAERAAALARAADTGAAEPLVAEVLQACTDWPPLTYRRDSALMSALAVGWESGWAQHAMVGRSLAGLAEAAGVGGSHASTPALAMARMLALAGETTDARAIFAGQRDALAETGRRPLRAIVDFDEGVALAAAGPARQAEAGQLLELAARSFEELGMSGWLDRTRRLLDAGFEAAARPGGRLYFTYPRGLTRREADLVRLVSGGASVADAAGRLDLEHDVAQRHLDAALEKLGAGSPADLPRLARRLGLGGGV